MGINLLDLITRFQGDDYPREVFQVFDEESGDPVDISNSDITVLVKMRKVSTDTVLMVKAGTKSTWANNGVFFLNWPTDALDEDEDVYRLEVSTSQSRTTGTITGASKASPCVITDVAHGLTTGDKVHIYDVAGMTELNDREYTVTVIDADSFSLDSEDSSDYTAYTSGGTWAKYAGIQTALTQQPIKIEEDF